MSTLTQHTGFLDMTTQSLIDHFGQATPVSPSAYSWMTSTSGRTITAYSILDDITYDAISPLGGTVNAIAAYQGSVLQYDAAGLTGSLVEIASFDNHETYWRAILAGETTAYFVGTVIATGDFVDVQGTETGSADVFEFSGNGGGYAIGDALSVQDGASLTGASDTYLITGAGTHLHAGDADSVVGGLVGGNDVFTVQTTGGVTNYFTGDTNIVSNDPTPVAMLAVTGGNDTFNIQTEAVNPTHIQGDFGTVGQRAVTGGNDTINAAGALAGTVIHGDASDLAGGSVLTAGDDVIIGSLTGSNLIWGDGRTATTIAADCGDDRITGGNAADTIYGDIQAVEGSTELHTNGHDLISGGGGNDTIEGQVGNDTIDGGRGNDSLNGGSGAGEINTVVFDTINAAVFVDLAGGIAFGQGGDTLAFFRNVIGSTRADTIGGDGASNQLTGGGGNDTLNGRAGNDTLNGGGGTDSLVGGLGHDTYVNPTGDTIVELANGGFDTVLSNQTFSIAALGEVDNITLTGNANANATGNAAGNRLFGNAAVNILIGGNGDDTLEGGGGKDQLIGGRNNDTMDGGAAADTFRFATSSTGNDRIFNFEFALDKFDLTGGTFSAATEVSGNTRLTHAGGTVLIMGVTGKTLAQWNAQVLPSGGTASIPQDPIESTRFHDGGDHAFPWAAVAPTLALPAFAEAGDWF